MTEATALVPGVEIGGYRIDRVLSASGSFGLVYLATDGRTDRVIRRREALRQKAETWRQEGLLVQDTPLPGPVVVIKEFMPPLLARRAANGYGVAAQRGKEALFAWSRKRFVDEANFLRNHSHPNVVAVFDVISSNNTDYMTMEWLSGGSLQALVEGGGERSEAAVRKWLLPILRGLQSAEAKGVNHLDLSPGNILFRTPGGAPVLIDFGAARMNGPSTKSSRLIVNDGYSAPEKYRLTSKGLNARSDVYSLAAVAIYALTGNTPTTASERETLARQRNLSAFGDLSKVRASSNFISALDACFDLDPRRRPAGAQEMEQRLAPWTQARPTPPPQPPQPRVLPNGSEKARRLGVTIFLVLSIMLLILLLRLPMLLNNG